jgi:excisionase family DNA binding protein
MTTKLSNETAVGNYLTVPEVCSRLRLGRTAVYGLMERGELAYAKFGKSRRIDATSLAEYVRRATIPARAG